MTRTDGHSALCRLLDGPTRRRGMPFVCIKQSEVVTPQAVGKNVSGL